MGLPLPIGQAKRLLILDRTDISTVTWPEFNTADVFIGARTPIVYTMCRRNLLRLHESVTVAPGQLGEQKWRD
ncbi:hypothetical protein [Saccharopolyspora taberi]